MKARLSHAFSGHSQLAGDPIICLKGGGVVGSSLESVYWTVQWTMQSHQQMQILFASCLFAWKRACFPQRQRRELFQLIRWDRERKKKKNNSENCCACGKQTEIINKKNCARTEEPCRIMSYWFSYVRKQNANKEESSKQGGPLLPLMFVWPKTNKTSPKLRVENLKWTQLSTRFEVQGPYVKSGSACSVSPCVMRKPAQIASKLVSKYRALLFSLPPLQCLLFRCPLTVCAVCFVYLQVCCDSRANSKGNWLSSLLSLSLLFSSCLLSSSLRCSFSINL